ncbi:MAG: hypothetical protein ACLQMF_03865 [Rectinemataceae bacterium]
MRIVVALLTAGLVAVGACSCGRMEPSSLASSAGKNASHQVSESAGSAVRTEPGRAMLIRGPLVFHGLPFFAPNALPGLEGEYSLVSGTAEPAVQGSSGGAPAERVLQLRIWYTREPLYFGTDWIRGTMGRYAIYTSKRDATGAVVIAFAADRYELLVELPSDDAELRRFAAALEDRFALFFADAATDADLSFPAYVDFATLP